MATETVDIVETPEERPRPGSLAERVRVRREELRTRADNLLDVPRYPWLKLEVRPISSRQQQTIRERNARTGDPARRELNLAADVLVLGTVGFRIVRDDGNVEPAEEHTWKEIATGLGARDDMTHRDALLLVVPDENVISFCNEYLEWLRGDRAGIEQELERDF